MTTNGAECHVFHVRRRDAKLVKNMLEDAKRLDKNFRMTPSLNVDGCIALPVAADDKNNDDDCGSPWNEYIVQRGIQFCPYSTARLGNASKGGNDAHHGDSNMTWVQQALHDFLASSNESTTGSSNSSQCLKERISQLPPSVCPKNLQVLGDDKTLVLPQKAFCWKDLQSGLLLPDATTTTTTSATEKNLHNLWKLLAERHGSPRVVRKGEIDPNSRVRESGHTLLWPVPDTDATTDKTGPGSPGWITVTEHGIKQSFDLTRVMFSRGNVTEKKRFGASLVQRGERVLDLYAGIGYYTLPALLLGNAQHVYACEWNPDALLALRYNLTQNGVNDDDKVTVIAGDSRKVLGSLSDTIGVDRVSLGLLPSSEGGWKTAVGALRNDVGGWLHIHANVPPQELRVWTEWMVWRLHEHVVQDSSKPDWFVVCQEVVRVKSFAPQVNHYVADVYCGPQKPTSHSDEDDDALVWVRVDKDKWSSFRKPPATKPSCALDDGGVLHQSWLRTDPS